MSKILEADWLMLWIFLFWLLPCSDDFLPQEAGPAQRLVGILGLCVCVCVLIGAAARYAASHWRTNKLDSWTGASSALMLAGS